MVRVIRQKKTVQEVTDGVFWPRAATGAHTWRKAGFGDVLLFVCW
jgi:hypothetical protein